MQRTYRVNTFRCLHPGRVAGPLAVALALAFPAVAQDFPVDAPVPPPIGQAVAEQAGDPASVEVAALPDSPPLVTPLHILDRHVLPGMRMQLAWNGSQGYAGNDVSAPVTVVHGAMAGPVLCLAAGIHGDEINGVEIVRRVMNGLAPEQVSGTVIGVPVVNLFGYQRGSRYLPDRRDLNRFFPGTRYGSIASRIAHSFFDNVVRHCDALVDFHTGSFDRSNLPQVRADLRIPEVLEFTRGFGATVILHSEGSQGMLRVAATAVGIPSVTFEVGAPARLQPEEIETAVDAINRLMHRMGLVASDSVEEEPQPIFYESRWIRADHGGLLISDVQLGQRVRRGQRLGRVIDPLGNAEREIVSPIFGRVLGMAQNQQVLPGFATYHLGEETSEEKAVEEAATGEAEAPVEEDGESGAPEAAAERTRDPEDEFE